MGLLDFFKKKQPAPTPTQGGYYYAPTMGGNVPFYSAFGEDIYASDLVMQAIQCKANEFKKLQPRHVVTKDGKQVVRTDSSIARVLRRPNPYMSQADFFEKITVLYELTKNVFIYPDYYITKAGEKHYTALYPLKPSSVTYLIDAGGRYYVQLEFASGYTVTLPVQDVIHWRKNFGLDDFFGGSMCGGDDNRGLLKSIREYDKLVQSIAKAVQVSCQINGLLHVNTYLSDEGLEEKRAAFEERLKHNESGLLAVDNQTTYTSLAAAVKLVDAETLKFYQNTILRATGASLPILNGDYTKAQKEAYYEHALEADIKSLAQAISRCVFTDREDAFGNEIRIYPNAIEFMTTAEKLQALQIMAPAGMLKKDEGRALVGLPPLDEGGDEMPRGYNNIDNDDKGGTNTDEHTEE